MLNVPITPPRVPFLNPSGVISREWYLFLLSLFGNTGRIDDTELNPSTNVILDAIADAAKQLESLESAPFVNQEAVAEIAKQLESLVVVPQEIQSVLAEVLSKLDALEAVPNKPPLLPLDGLLDVTAPAPVDHDLLEWDETTESYKLTNTIYVNESFTGDFAGGDYRHIETTGFEENFGDAQAWDDVYPSAAALGRGSAAPPISVYSAPFEAPEFPGAAVGKEITLQFQIYHSYNQGTDVVPHLHLYIPDDATGGTIKFSADWHWDNVNTTGAVASGSVSGTIVRGAAAGIALNQILSFGAFTGAGKHISSILTLRVLRDPGDAADTFGSSVWLRSADVHIRKNTEGSRSEFVK